MSALLPESTTSSLTDSELATAAGVPEIAVEKFRAGIPHWSLERPGVMNALAAEIGADPQQFRATFERAKLAAVTQRRTTAGPAGFGGSFTSIRG